ncbi:MAG: tyrosine-type recombinase/integrase [Polyangiales bacterium]
MTRSFESWLAEPFERFIAMKRAGGAIYGSQKNLLLAFDRYLYQYASEPPLERDTVLRYLASSKKTPRARDNVVCVLWQALAHARRHGARVERLPERPPKPPAYWRRRQPRIVAPEEMKRWLQAAYDLPPADGWRAVTIATLLGLLYVTGMRIGEALALHVDALDRGQGILTVVRGKFGKSRLLPLRPSTVQALAHYIDHPQRPIHASASSPIFMSTRQRRLSMCAAQTGIDAAARMAEISPPQPRPHDLRHTFAISRLAACYAEGRDPQALLPILSTYLGHGSIEATREYLVANGSILESAAQQFSAYAMIEDEVGS